MKKRLFAALAAAALLICLLPAAAFAYYPYPTKAVYVGGINVMSGYETATALPGGQGKATGTVRFHLENGFGVLELTNVTVPKGDSAMNSAIFSEGDLTIVLNGTNTVTGPDNNDDSYGVYVDANLTVRGTGSLTAVGGNTNLSEESASAGLLCGAFFTLDGATLTAVGGAAKDTEFSSGACPCGALVENNAVFNITKVSP